MEEQRHERITELFLQASELEPSKRPAFLDRECDVDLRSEVESLLAHDEDAVLKTGAGAGHMADLISMASNGGPAGPIRRQALSCAGCGAELPAGQFACAICRTRTVAPHDAPVVPGYEIVRLIGEGGMGAVYLAEDTILGRRVAVKTLTPALAADERAARRFAREARAMASVEHPHIARVYSFGEAAGRLYIVMEFVDGESLAQRMRSVGSLPLPDALTIVRQVTQALDAAWGNGIVHRDIKPANILLDKREHVRVVDFGLAKSTTPQGDPGLTVRGQLLGTPLYLSPEQARGELEIDFRTDIYSLGIVLFELLAGKPPFEGHSPMTIVDQHLHAPLPSVRASRADVPGEAEQLCDWMTRKQPADRPGSYAALLQALDALLGDGATAPAAQGGPLPVFLARAGATANEDDDGAGFPFVGRTAELEQLDETLARTIAGHTRAVLVAGEAGSGKTALIDEFARLAQTRHADLIVARGRCNGQSGMGDPYLPFREILALLTGDVEAGRSSGAIGIEHGRRLWSLLPDAVEALVDDGPDLLGSFVAAAPLVARATAFTPSPAAWRVRLEELARRRLDTPRDAALQQSYLFEQYTRMLRRLARARPLLLVLEDLHWADPGSSRLLSSLRRGIQGSRIMLVVSYRPTDVGTSQDDAGPPARPVIRELSHDFCDPVLRLDEEGARDLLEALVDSEANQLDSAFRDALYHQTRGHPLFTIELLRGMRERGMLVLDEDERWVPGAELDWEMLPERVEGAIGGRIDRLPEELQELLSLASVHGEEFSAEVLAEVQGVKPRTMVTLLSRELGQRYEIVSPQAVRRIDGQRISTYRFRNILYQRYLYGRLDRAEQAYLHEEVGTILERMYGDQVEEVAIQLGHHFHEAGVADKTIHYLRQAGDRAVKLSANEEAIGHYTEALRVLAIQEDDSIDAPREELGLQLALGPPLLGTAGPGSVELSRAYQRARELCSRVGTPGQLFQTLFILVHHHANHGELPRALELAEQLLQIANDADEPLPVIMAYWARGFVNSFLGEFERAGEDHHRVVELYDPERDAALAYVFGMDPAVSSLSLHAQASWCLGFPERAEDFAARALELARAIDHPSSLAHTLTQAAGLAMFLRDTDMLQARLESLQRVSTEKGVELFRAWSAFVCGWLTVEQGRVDEGIERIRAGLVDYAATGSQLGRPLALGCLADALGRAERPDEGRSVIAEAIETANRTGECLFTAELHRLDGELLLRTEPAAMDAALACFDRAVELARAQHAKSWELRALISRTRLLADRGDSTAARDRLAAAFGGFAEGLATADLTEARALLASL